MSYFVVGIVGVLFYRVPAALALGLPRRHGRCSSSAACSLETNFTSLGHLCALLLGLACYPLTRRRRTSPAAYTPAVAISDGDLGHLRRCVELAREALEAGDQPFGSLLVDADGAVRFEDRNRIKDGDATRHPEFEIARWSAEHLTPDERAGATVYTSGEHCPMCAAAHAWVGLGRIVYAASTAQLVGWLRMWGVSGVTGGAAADLDHRARRRRSTGLHPNSPRR